VDIKVKCKLDKNETCFFNYRGECRKADKSMLKLATRDGVDCCSVGRGYDNRSRGQGYNKSLTTRPPLFAWGRGI
jgi:hypothetical protein